MNGTTTNDGSGGSSGGGNLADSVVSSALRYRAQAPLLDQLMAEVGLSGGDLNGLTGTLRQSTSPSEAQAATETPPTARSRKAKTIPAAVEPIELVAEAEDEEDTET